MDIKYVDVVTRKFSIVNLGYYCSPHILVNTFIHGQGRRSSERRISLYQTTGRNILSGYTRIFLQYPCIIHPLSELNISGVLLSETFTNIGIRNSDKKFRCNTSSTILSNSCDFCHYLKITGCLSVCTEGFRYPLNCSFTVYSQRSHEGL